MNMLRRLVKLLVAAAIIYAGWHAGVAYLHYYQFKDALGELALFSRNNTEEQVRTRVMELAEQNRVPLSAESVTVFIDRDTTRIAAPYTERVRLLPNYTYEWKLEARAEVTHVR